MYEIGDTVYVSFRNKNTRDSYYSITNVGRKWIRLENRLRFDKTSNRLDGGNYSSPGMIWRKLFIPWYDMAY